MLQQALRPTGNLLDSQGHYPMDTINKFASAVPEDVRQMFLDLYDETKDLVERVKRFKGSAEKSSIPGCIGNAALCTYG